MVVNGKRSGLASKLSVATIFVGTGGTASHSAVTAGGILNNVGNVVSRGGVVRDQTHCLVFSSVSPSIEHVSWFQKSGEKLVC